MPVQTFSMTVDENQRLITVQLTGRDDSAYYTDCMLAAYSELAEPWRYNRLIDQRHFRGLIAYEDLQRVAAMWARIMQGRPEKPRVAMLTRDSLTTARVASSGKMFTASDFRTFSSHGDAMDWLMERTVTAA